MKVHLRQIPQGETLHIEGEEDASALGLQEAGAEPKSPLRYSLDVGVSESGIFASGRLELTIGLTCVACLQKFEQEIIVDPFAMQEVLDGKELVDLTPAVREDIHLLLPAHPRCDSDGNTRCPASFPQAGVLKDAPATATGWGALDQLKIKKTD
jgi:uncharacterized metal-binding protein YceD (DUF177 family)